PYLEGVEGDIAEHIDIEHAAHVLGRMLAYMHRLPVDEVKALGVPVEGNPIEDSLELARRRAATIPDVTARLRRDALDTGGLRPAQTQVLAHNDLWGEHSLIDPQLGRVTGIIDWADACIGDPASDYGGLLAWLGESFLVRALEAGGVHF